MQIPLTSGSFLLSTPVLEGSYFQNKVVFLAEHNDNGSYGLILNHTAGIPIDEVFSGNGGNDRKPFRFFFGGPVQEEMVQILETNVSQLTTSTELLPGIWLGSLGSEDRVPILDLFANPTTRIFLGYSGWGAGQLENEVEKGCWEVVQPDPSDILSLPRDKAFPSPSEFKRQFALS